MSEASKTPLLDQINMPADLRRLDSKQLRQLADELRQETIDAVAVTGGHLGAGLGVIELTVALHYVFNTPDDRLIWDVGHQAYPHKILTGRRDRIRTLRMGGGLSGFTRRVESPYDPFGAAHSSTSISAGLGWVCALEKEFTGEEELRRIKEAGPERKLVAFVMEESGIPRQGMTIAEGGEVTSGSHSPMLELGIGLGYVPSELAQPGSELTIDVRGRSRRARVVKKPIYSREET